MNKIFRVIWNAATASWVAVSEIARTPGSKPGVVFVRGKRLSNAQSASALALRCLRLTPLAATFFLSGILSAQAASVNLGTGDGVAFQGAGCKKSSAGHNDDVALGCGAATDPVAHAILDRMNPYEDKKGLVFDPEISQKNTTTGQHSVAIGSGTSAGQGGAVVGAQAKGTYLSVAMGLWSRASDSAVSLGPRAHAASAGQCFSGNRNWVAGYRSLDDSNGLSIHCHWCGGHEEC